MNDLKTKPCAVCGEPARGRAKYCSPSCRRRAKKKRDNKRRGYKERDVFTCEMCGDMGMAHFSGQRFCSKHTQAEKDRWRKYGDTGVRVGDPMACAVCGDTITREAPNQLWCKTWCEGEIRCTCCGEVKDSREYYDYRPHGKRLSRCKECERTKALERAERRRG